MPYYAFPKKFVWGAATASYQIEGATEEDGRGASVWDAFCARPGCIKEGHSGRQACDHYHRWEEDLDLLKALGFKAYRFSIAWPRILPTGRGKVNPRGLDFYSRLVDGMLERGIEPFVTLYHWDMPQALEERGGWRVRGTADAFGEYAAVVARALGDRVRYFATHNEMSCFVDLGHRTGVHAPGCKESEKTLRQIWHHVLLAHGLGVQAVRAAAPRKPSVGIAHNPLISYPITEREEDIALAREIFRDTNGWMTDPLFYGSYPEKMRKELGRNAPRVRTGDMESIRQPLDWVGLNIYGVGQLVGHDIQTRHHQPWDMKTDMGWGINCDCLYWGLRFMREVYDAPEMFITENGAAYPDPMLPNGHVEDLARVEYLKLHLRGVQRAIKEGLPVRGYFVWSLMDNFEWAEGYTRRFGIVHVNYETQKRTPKASAYWLAKAIADGGF